MDLVEFNDKEVGLVVSREEAMFILALCSMEMDSNRDLKKMEKQLRKTRLLRSDRRRTVEETLKYFQSKPIINGHKTGLREIFNKIKLAPPFP